MSEAVSSKKVLSGVDKLLGDLVMYLEPGYFLGEPHIPGPRFSKEMCRKYHEFITAVNWFQKKIARYPLYFQSFYPADDDIKNYEALEHHVHAYLEDLETVRNKLHCYISSLRNDLKKFATNKEEIVAALNWLEGQVFKTFNNVSENRNPHRHKGFKFADKYITDGQMAEMALDKALPIKAQLSEHGLQEMQKIKSESFEQGKKYWSENAVKNYEQVSSLTDAVLEKTKDFLYQFLDIKAIN